MAAGLISYEVFTQLTKDFLQKSSPLTDNWTIQTSSTGEEYLVKKVENVSVVKNDENESKASDISDDFVVKTTEGILMKLGRDEVLKSLEEEDPSCLKTDWCRSSVPVMSEYHVVYSTSYSVPVLYFNIHKQDGKLLTLEEVWQNVPAYYRDRLEHERWTFITQQEHPLLHRPFYQLHPCHTADLMKCVPQNGDPSQYLVSWLSSVGPVVGLNIPLAYGLQQDKGD